MTHLGGNGEGHVHVTSSAEVAHEVVTEAVMLAESRTDLLPAAGASIVLTAEDTATPAQKGARGWCYGEWEHTTHKIQNNTCYMTIYIYSYYK